eukprot:5346533-Prymnesium_polylepis.2
MAWWQGSSSAAEACRGCEEVACGQRSSGGGGHEVCREGRGALSPSRPLFQAALRPPLPIDHDDAGDGQLLDDQRPGELFEKLPKPNSNPPTRELALTQSHPNLKTCWPVPLWPALTLTPTLALTTARWRRRRRATSSAKRCRSTRRGPIRTASRTASPTVCHTAAAIGGIWRVVICRCVRRAARSREL